MTVLQAKLVQNNNSTWLLEFNSTKTNQKVFQLTSIKELTPILEYALQLQAHKLIIDLATTERIDSQGLQLLLVMQLQFSKEKIQVVLRNPNMRLRRLLKVMQFDRVFVIEEDNYLGSVVILFGTPPIRRNGI